jgi:hypothetical protein
MFTRYTNLEINNNKQIDFNHKINKVVENNGLLIVHFKIRIYNLPMLQKVIGYQVFSFNGFSPLKAC